MAGKKKMSDLSMRDKISNKYTAMYEASKQRELAYQETLKAEMPQMKQLLEGHSKAGQVLGIFGSIIWPVLAGAGMGGIIGVIIGALVCAFPVGAVVELTKGNTETSVLVVLAIYIIGVVITFLLMVSNASTKKANKKIQHDNDEKMRHYNEELQDISNKKAQSNQRIAQEKERTDALRKAEIARYDADVDAFCQQALGNSGIAPMVEKTVEMFKRMVSHQESGTDVKYVEADFNYEVSKTGIAYIYGSGYSNPESEFNFQKERFHDLNRDEECEGLAKALSVLVVARMKEEYPSDLTTIKVSNQDAYFNLYFKTANENFEAARDIF
ncbi:MAG: hypothetical protein HDQ99_20325 [Lachnospiraceae bacterium]|nr:hypothetical protein [Lachnospiraceae bacterium]